ncbi:MAG: TolC family protein [Planctomycetales bacterium]|nr:TolC family protein [Planctomycetales bacterium]
MNRELRSYICIWLSLLTLASGCHPTQPFFFREDGDLSHYMDVASTIEYPEVDAEPLVEATASQEPLTLANFDTYQFWDLSLEEVTRMALENSQVMRTLGGRITDGGQNISQSTPETITTQGTNVATTYDPALVESGPGTGTGSQFSGTGVEAALAAFDAQLNSNLLWQYNDRPQNFGLASIPNFFAPNFRQDIGQGALGITKTTGDGSTFGLTNNYAYDQNNNGSRIQPSDWNVNVEATFSKPLLQGAGTQINRIAGPQTFQQAQSGFLNTIDGVMIARIRHDISLNDFEIGVRNLMRDVEDAYWELYFSYRDLEARKIGRDSALVTWQRVKALQRAGQSGGEADQEAQARSQYFLFRSQVETALTSLYRVENRLRYVMGLAATDGRLIRPSDELTTAQIHFDWAAVHAEALVRRSELRKQKWQVKRRELELVASKNQILPRLDVSGTYRWLGAGDELINSYGNGLSPFANGSNAWEVLTDGNYQEWQLGLNFTMPIGFRTAMSGIRHHQLLLARERAVLQDLELEVSHQLTDAVRDLDLNYAVAQTNFNRRVASEDEVEARQALYDVGQQTLDFLLQAQQRRADAESAFFRSLVDYNRAIMRVHYRKGSLLEYNGVYLAEGPWPGKAYFDALRRARQRDASVLIDYGFTRPSVISRGPYTQNSGTIGGEVIPHGALDGPLENDPTPAEEIPAPNNLQQPNLTNPAGNNSVSLIQPLPAVDAMPTTGMVVPASALQVLPREPAGNPPGATMPTVSPAQFNQQGAVNPFRNNPTAWSTDAGAAPSTTASHRPENPFVSQAPAAATTPAYVPTAIHEYQTGHATDQAAAGVAGGSRR